MTIQGKVVLTNDNRLAIYLLGQTISLEELGPKKPEAGSTVVLTVLEPEPDGA